MARAGHETDAQPFQVVVRVGQGVDLQLAAVARAGIHFPDRQRLPQDAQQLGLDPGSLGLRRLTDVGRGLAADTRLDDLPRDFPNHRSCPE
ncbi:hypothetical protein D9M69_619240 [compost metagenome]